jgi:hypothetical protein
VIVRGERQVETVALPRGSGCNAIKTVGIREIKRSLCCIIGIIEHICYRVLGGFIHT